jgi:CheY-like chemotaxis protein/glycine cleavage system H lipoate-binding protein
MKGEPNILVVDDEPIILQSCKRILNESGYDVETAPDGDDALKKITIGKFDLVLLDLKMPGMGGLTLLNRIKDYSPNIEIIVMTGYPSVQTVKYAIKSGAYDYIPKPFKPDTINEAASKALEHKHWRLFLQKASQHKNNNIANIKETEFKNECWLVHECTGSIKVGLQHSFIESLESPVYIEAPIIGSTVIEGESVFKIVLSDCSIYEISIPANGRVIAVNEPLIRNIDLLKNDDNDLCWIIEVTSDLEKQDLDNKDSKNTTTNDEGR